MGNSPIVNKINALLAEKGISKQNFYKDCGITSASYSLWNTGKTKPRMKNLEIIAEYLNVPVSYLVSKADKKESATSISGDDARSRFLSVQNIEPVPAFRKKPRLGTIACGKPILAVEDAEEFDFVPDNIDCDFTLRCKGDSMINARIFDGDIVYIRKQPEVENGEIAAVRIGDEATLKRVYYSGDRLILRAANPLYADMEFDGVDLENVEIMGKAVAFTSLIR